MFGKTRHVLCAVRRYSRAVSARACADSTRDMSRQRVAARSRARATRAASRVQQSRSARLLDVMHLTATGAPFASVPSSAAKLAIPKPRSSPLSAHYALTRRQSRIRRLSCLYFFARVSAQQLDDLTLSGTRRELGCAVCSCFLSRVTETARASRWLHNAQQRLLIDV